jgi:uncharacterized protein
LKTGFLNRVLGIKTLAMFSQWLRRMLVLPVLLSAMLGGGVVWAQDIQPIPPLSDRVMDQTQTLDAGQKQALIQQLAGIEAQYGSQVVVLMLPSTQPEDIAAFAQRVADAWKIGRRGVGDGLLIVVAKDDHKVRIEVAKTLEGAIPDLMAKRVINERIKPAFKAGNYALGLQGAVDQLGRLIAGEALPPPQPGGASKGKPPFDFAQFAMFLFIATPIIGAVLTGLFGRKLGSVLTGGTVGAIGWLSTASVFLALGIGGVALFLVGVMGLGATGMGRGGLGSRSGPVIWGGGGSGGWGGGGGGGFGSGGGGDFGGGGASGDW